MRAASPIAALAPLLLVACSSAPGSSAVASSQATLASPPPVETQAVAPPAAPHRPVEASALVDGPESRDPFQTFAEPKPPPPPEPHLGKARRIPIDQLKLVALVTNTATPRAMLVDPSGKGYIVTRGELVGRPEQDGDRVARFRVDRIRDGDVVLVREETPGVPSSTRVLTMPRTPLLQADD